MALRKLIRKKPNKKTRTARGKAKRKKVELEPFYPDKDRRKMRNRNAKRRKALAAHRKLDDPNLPF